MSTELLLPGGYPIAVKYIISFGWVSSRPAHQTVVYTEWHIPDVILIQLILLMMGTWLPETCRE